MVKTTNLRLNLDKPNHRKAYEILQNSDKSYSKTIVAALLSFSENEENRKHLFDGIRKIVREEISAVFENVDIVQENISEKSIISAEAPKSKNSKNDNIADADYDENEEYVDDDFLNM
ncbi:MAG: hypothetical protein KH324_08720 [Ruminococcus sp.]|jgi:hypothetical protein|nr:hypothetical protein [Ruminococcus sp.]